MLQSGEIASDTSIDCLLSNVVDGTYTKEFKIQENKNCDLNIVDLSNNSMDVKIKLSLKKGANCCVNLASICPQNCKKRFTIDVIHEEPDTYSRTKMAGINLGDGTLFFFGTSDVWKGAHGSDTRQEGKITNLSPGSRSEVSPALLIKDNEVNASHGAALGAYDPEAMYYMMSRGLSEAESRKLITIGSLVPIIEALSDKELVATAMKSLEALDL